MITDPNNESLSSLEDATTMAPLSSHKNTLHHHQPPLPPLPPQPLPESPRRLMVVRPSSSNDENNSKTTTPNNNNNNNSGGRRQRLVKSLSFSVRPRRSRSKRNLTASSLHGGVDADHSENSCHTSRTEREDDDASCGLASSTSSLGRASSSAGTKLTAVRLLRRRRTGELVVAAPRPEKKVVQFAEELATGVGRGVASASHNSKQDLFYSRKELAQFAQTAQRLGEEVGWKRDRKVVPCLRLCYGFSNTTTTDSNESASTTNNSKDTLTIESAIQYLYYYQVSEDPEKIVLLDEEQQDAQAKDPASETTSSSTATTSLRGLERQLAPCITDYRMNCIQSILSLQAKLRAGSQGVVASPELMATALRKQSSSLSSKSRRFARLLGKGDAAICGYKSSSSSSSSNSNLDGSRRGSSNHNNSGSQHKTTTRNGSLHSITSSNGGGSPCSSPTSKKNGSVVLAAGRSMVQRRSQSTGRPSPSSRQNSASLTTSSGLILAASSSLLERK